MKPPHLVHIHIAAHLVQVCEFLFVSFAIISQACYTDGLHFLNLNFFFFCSPSIDGILLLPLPEHDNPFTSSWQHHPLRGFQGPGWLLQQVAFCFYISGKG